VGSWVVVEPNGTGLPSTGLGWGLGAELPSPPTILEHGYQRLLNLKPLK